MSGAARPLVSIVVVCHNDWPDVELAIASALQQSYAPVEVIVVDNHSTDATPVEVPARFGDRLQYHWHAATRTADGRNKGVELARGQYIQFLDGDDVLAPNKIEKQVAFLEARPDVDLAVGTCRRFRGTPDVPASALEDIEDFTGPDIKRALIERLGIPPIAFLARREAIDRIGPQDPSIWFEDYEYWLRAAFLGLRFERTPDAWAFYRRRRGQKTQSARRTVRAEVQVFSRALGFIAETPYRELARARLARAWRVLAHDCLWRGKRRRALAMLRKAESLDPRASALAAKSALLANVPGGDRAYRAYRRLRRLPAPFAAVRVA